MNFNTNTPELSDLKKIYDENGYNHIPELFSKSDMELINNEFDRYIKDCVPKMKEGEVYYVDKENKDTLMQMQKLEEYDAFFEDDFEDDDLFPEFEFPDDDDDIIEFELRDKSFADQIAELFSRQQDKETEKS